MEWPFGGYLEIQSGKTKYCLIDKQDLMRLFGFHNLKELREEHQSWVEEALQAGGLSREERWTESVAVGSLEFVGRVKKELGDRGIGKQAVGDGRIYMLQETRSNYDTFSRGKK
jgi:putative transposase